MKSKKIIMPLMLVLIIAFGGFFTFYSNSVKMQVQASTGIVTQEIGPNDSVSVPLENLIIKNFEYDVTAVDSTGFADLLKFVLTNGSETAVIWFYLIRGGKHSTGYYPAYTYGCDLSICVPRRYACPQCAFWGFPCYDCDREYAICGCDILLFTETSNGLVITHNTKSFYANIFDTVTIYTYQSRIIVSAGSVTPTEFVVSFKDIDGNLIGIIETVGRYIPIDLIPVAPLINQRPFLRWTNVQGCKIDEIITADVTFLPMYSYDPNFKVDDTGGTESTNSPSALDDIDFELLLICAVGVLAFLCLVFIFFKGKRK